MRHALLAHGAVGGHAGQLVQQLDDRSDGAERREVVSQLQELLGLQSARVHARHRAHDDGHLAQRFQRVQPALGLRRGLIDRERALEAATDARGWLELWIFVPVQEARVVSQRLERQLTVTAVCRVEHGGVLEQQRAHGVDEWLRQLVALGVHDHRVQERGLIEAQAFAAGLGQPREDLLQACVGRIPSSLRQTIARATRRWHA